MRLRTVLGLLARPPHRDPLLGDRVVDAELARRSRPGVGDPVDPAVADAAEDDQVALEHGRGERARRGVVAAGGGVGDDGGVGLRGGPPARRPGAAPGWPGCRCRPACWRRARRVPRARRPGWPRRSRARWTPRRRPPARPAIPARRRPPSPSRPRCGGAGRPCRSRRPPRAPAARCSGPAPRRLGAAGLAVAVGADDAATVRAGPGSGSVLDPGRPARGPTE